VLILCNRYEVRSFVVSVRIRQYNVCLGFIPICFFVKKNRKKRKNWLKAERIMTETRKMYTR